MALLLYPSVGLLLTTPKRSTMALELPSGLYVTSYMHMIFSWLRMTLLKWVFWTIWHPVSEDLGWIMFHPPQQIMSRVYLSIWSMMENYQVLSRIKSRVKSAKALTHSFWTFSSEASIPFRFRQKPSTISGIQYGPKNKSITLLSKNPFPSTWPNNTSEWSTFMVMPHQHDPQTWTSPQQCNSSSPTLFIAIS